MTRDHYDMIAATINEQYRTEYRAGRDITLLLRLITNLSDQFANDNPRFNRARFVLSATNRK